MEIIETRTNENIQLKYTPTIKDNSLNWFNIDSQKSITNNATIWNSTPFSNQGITGVYNTLTPLTMSSYVNVEQQKTELVLMKLVQASNGEDRNIMYIIGNRQLKCMLENGTIRSTATSPISAYNSVGLCGKRTSNFSQLITATYTDEHGNTRYYWQDYGEFTYQGFKWSIKKLLKEFFIKVADDLADINIYAPTNTFPYSDYTTQNIVLSGINGIDGLAGFTIRNDISLNDSLKAMSIVHRRTVEYRRASDGNYRVILDGLIVNFALKLTINTEDDICIFKMSKSYRENINSDDYIGGYGWIKQIDDDGVVSYKKTGTPPIVKEIEIPQGQPFIIVPIDAMLGLIRGWDLSGLVPTSTSYSTTIADSPLITTQHIYDYLPDIDILQLLRIYQFGLNKDITIDESTLQTSIIPTPTQMRYYTIISYTQKFDTFGSFKAKNNLIKIEGDDQYEETTILDVNLSNANIVELEDTAEIATLPSRAYYPDININTHTAKSYTRCYEVVISISYADLKNNLIYISFFAQKARVLSGQYDNETQTAKLIILI